MEAPLKLRPPRSQQLCQLMLSGAGAAGGPQSAIAADNWCLTQIKVCKFSYMWTIGNFSSCPEKTGEKLVSSTFSAGTSDKRKWVLELKPRGDKEESKDYVSLYLLLLKCEARSETRAKFKFSIVNAKREEANVLSAQNVYMPRKSWGYPKFIKRDSLFDKSRGLLPENKLTIYCEISVFTEARRCSDYVGPLKPGVLDNRLPEDLEFILKSQEFSDITIHVKGKEFKAHRSILAARSPMFKAMFSHDLIEAKKNCVEVRDVEADVFEKMLIFIYTGKTSLEARATQAREIGGHRDENQEEEELDEGTKDRRLVVGLLQAADKYQLDQLKSICEELLCKTFSSDSITEIIYFADLYSAAQLKTQAIKFISAHAAEVIKTRGWARMMDENRPLVDEIITEIALLNAN